MTENVRTLATLELVGGAWCLDFTNTINSRLYREHDYLTEYSDLIGWANKQSRNSLPRADKSTTETSKTK